MRKTAFLLVWPFLTAWGQQYDLLLKGGHVIDPANSIDAIRDVAIAGGKIARVAANIPASEARRTVDDPSGAAQARVAGEASARVPGAVGETQGKAQTVVGTVNDPEAAARTRAEAEVAGQQRNVEAKVGVSAEIKTPDKK